MAENGMNGGWGVGRGVVEGKRRKGEGRRRDTGGDVRILRTKGDDGPII